jgi:hypothetical protein
MNMAVVPHHVGWNKKEKNMLDEEGELPTVIGNLTPISFVVHEETIVFVDESL